MIVFGSAIEIVRSDGAEPQSDDTVHQPDFPQLYADYFDCVWGAVRRLGVHDDALDDVVQEVFLAAYKRLSSFEGRSSLKSWLLGIAVHCVQRHRRTARRKSPHSLDRSPTDPETLDSPKAGPHDLYLQSEAARIVQQILDNLDEDKRTVFVLAEFEQLSASEIASVVEVPVNTVYSRLRHARQEFSAAATRYRARERGDRP